MTTKSKLFWGILSFIVGSISVYFFINDEIFNLDWPLHLWVFGGLTLTFYCIAMYIFLFAPTKKNYSAIKENIKEPRYAKRIEYLDSKPSPLKWTNSNQSTSRIKHEYPKEVNPNWVFVRFLLITFVVFAIVAFALFIYRN